jgi:hypothetical protein
VLSEGQNLQDAAIVVNYDLPWAIIRLIQRVGRVDRIGQRSANITCYSFLPAAGVNEIIRLRDRLTQRLGENAEVVGTDERFFEDDADRQHMLDIYNESSGSLDREDDAEVDLASYAYQIWLNATTDDPKLSQDIPTLKDVVYSTRRRQPGASPERGVIVYMQTAEGTDALALLNGQGEAVTESQYVILRAAQCEPETPPVERLPEHFELVNKAVDAILKEDMIVGGQLGRATSPRYRLYGALKLHVSKHNHGLFQDCELEHVIDDIYRFPLERGAAARVKQHLKSGVSDERLAEIARSLWQQDRLCMRPNDRGPAEPRIICSMGISDAQAV